ncbi:hypothetical protein ACIGHG_14165 [Bacillus sp. NPDC077411]
MKTIMCGFKIKFDENNTKSWDNPLILLNFNPIQHLLLVHAG